jgi:gas vesicle protein
MINEAAEEKVTPRNPLSVFLGLLVGGLAGAVTVLLLAPQSGKDTRMQIREKGIDLQTQTTKMVNDRVKQVRSTMTELGNSWHIKIEGLKQSVLDLADEKLGS